jgi:hypothetical protein
VAKDTPCYQERCLHQEEQSKLLRDRVQEEKKQEQVLVPMEKSIYEIKMARVRKFEAMPRTIQSAILKEAENMCMENFKDFNFKNHTHNAYFIMCKNRLIDKHE